MKWVSDRSNTRVYYNDVDGIFFAAVLYKRKSMWRFSIRKLENVGYQVIGSVPASLKWKTKASVLVKKFMSGY